VLWGLTRVTHLWQLAQHLASDKCYVAAAAAKSLQSCPTLCDPIDGSPSGSPVPGILQARTLEWVAISFSNAGKWKVKVKSLSRIRPSATPWTAAYQAPPSMGFSRQEYWSGVPLPSPNKNATRKKKKKKNTGLFTWTTRHLKGSEIFSFQTKCLPKSTLIDKHFRGDSVGKVCSSSISLHLWLQHNCADLMSSSPWINPRDGAH